MAVSVPMPPRTPVLIVLHPDGYLEVFGEQHVSVHTANIPIAHTLSGKCLSEDIVEMLLTGLRRGELTWLTIGSLSLDSRMPHLILSAGDAKNRHRAEIPLRDDLAKELTH